jgi:peroxiredoxin
MLIVLAVGAGLWWFEIRGSGDAPGVGQEGFGITTLPAGLNSTGREPAAQEGRAAPDFKLQGLNGESLTLSGFRGSFVLINFWASWCSPCRGETPDLQRFFERSKERGLVVLGVNQQEPAATARRFLDEFAVTYPIALDRDGQVSVAYRTPGLPVSVLVDPQGVVRRIYRGRVTEADLAALDREFLK